jgi:ribonuclease HII
LRKSTKNLPLFPETEIPSEDDPFYHEQSACNSGYGLIAGVDEAGRGPLAGPVVAAAVILPRGIRLPGVKDSKKMTEAARERAFSNIDGIALAVGIGVVSHNFIDRHNILKASLEAMKRAVLCLNPNPEYLLVDGIHPVPLSLPQRCIKKGDQLSHTISAASIMAKVYRDRIMRTYDLAFPVYGFLNNKGYGTARHISAIKKHGPCPIHRLTFKRVR